ISLPFFVFFRFGGMPRAKGLFRAKVSKIYFLKKRKFILNILILTLLYIKLSFSKNTLKK
ncbi:hypothetical protein, partial [Acinetobacter sp. AS5]|uniref:hypothetical protein n=1 Tax=Acinetobacter sp. AS5 TaxID=3029187 RepID=UPI003B819B00